MSTTQYGYFLIADITGYTSFLSKSELEHAQQTLTALLNLLIRHTKPPLIISRLAGDAVISYGLRDNFFQGQTFVEMIEDTYVAFRRTIDLMVLNTTCKCNACANINALDLKFFLHYGAFGIQKLDSHNEIVGADVIVIHRLLKNHVTERTGFRAYALYTDAAIRQLGLSDICETMTPHIEAYEYLGEVKTWIQDMHPVWQAKKDAVEVSIPPEKIVFAVEAEIDPATGERFVSRVYKGKDVFPGASLQRMPDLQIAFREGYSVPSGTRTPTSTGSCWHRSISTSSSASRSWFFDR